MLLTVGQIVRPHGVHGECVVIPRTDSPSERFHEGAVFVVSGAAGASQLTIATVRSHMGRFLVVFDEIADRDAAEAARGTFLEIDSSTVSEPEDPDEFLDHQLVGLAVFDTSGARLGEVSRIDHGPAHDMLIVRLSEGRNVLVPFVKAIVPTVDVANGRIIIDPPGGLLEL
jgi:16S rRNA processing protein RimM